MSDEPDQQSLANGHLVQHLATAAIYASGHLTRCPTFLREVLETNAWKRFAIAYTQDVFEYTDFDSFARAAIPAGLQIPDGVAGLVRICEVIRGEDADIALRLMRDLLPAEKPHGANQYTEGRDNITSLTRGTSGTYLLRRLKRDKPELADKVVNGEISAHAAAIEAGFRERMVQHPATVDGFLRGIEKHLTANERRALKNKL